MLQEWTGEFVFNVFHETLEIDEMRPSRLESLGKCMLKVGYRHS
jgi:hypothetical protein